MSDKSSNLGKDAIVAMWIGVAIIDFGVALSTIDNGNPLGWPFMVPLLIGLFGTLYIVSVQPWLEARMNRASQDQGKAKRGTGDLMAVLMELMDEDERAAFKQKLQQRVLGDAAFAADGEIPDNRMSLESLMQNEEADSLHG